ncbi:MAG: MFS transporter, partial [Firmicutes bacterium]|nr:MFS transporter [Bacillota bacterium]
KKNGIQYKKTKKVAMFKLPSFSKLERSWILYDIANSAYILTIITVLFPIYYQTIAANIDNRTQIFAFVTAGIALTDAILAPIIGSLSDYRGNKKKFFKIFLTLGILGGLFLAIPGLSPLALIVVFIISSIGYNMSNVVYDAFLVDVTDESRMDKVSSAGYAWGYIGSMIPFAIAILPYALVTLGFLNESFEQLSVSFAFIVAIIWWYVFSQPILKDVKQVYEIEHEEKPVLRSYQRLFRTFKDIKKYKMIFLFMIAYLFYIDVVNTVIRLATTLGSDLGVGVTTLLGVVVLVQVVAFPSAIIYGKLASKYGGKIMILWGILVYAITIGITYFISEETTYLMWIVGLLVGTAQGGIQSISRSYFAKMLPTEKSNEFFGFFSVFGKFSGIISPFLLGLVINSWGTNQAVLILYGPLAIGTLLFFFVNPNKSLAK